MPYHDVDTCSSTSNPHEYLAPLPPYTAWVVTEVPLTYAEFEVKLQPVRFKIPDPVEPT